jgi:hypothetical protein
MERIRLHFDKFAKLITLNGAIARLMGATFFFCQGFFFDLEKFAKTGDRFWLYIGIFSIGLSLIWVPWCVLLIHAIVRRMVGESRNLVQP